VLVVDRLDPPRHRRRRAAGHEHVPGCTGSTSERTVQELHGLPEDALLDMGDFAGAVLKYLRRHPVPRLTVAGGIGKLAKLADGHLDLHSAARRCPSRRWPRGSRRRRLPELVAGCVGANTALHALQQCQAAGLPLGDLVAAGARRTALGVLAGPRWRSTSWSSTGAARWWAALNSGISSSSTGGCRGTAPREHRADDDDRRPPHPRPPRPGRRCRPACHAAPARRPGWRGRPPRPGRRAP
jgi:diadenosine tetraphosphate (Ap4A) HIT family hydrolase